MQTYLVDRQHDLTFWLGPLRLTCGALESRRDFLARAEALGFEGGRLDGLTGLGLAADQEVRDLSGACLVERFQGLPEGTWGGTFILEPQQLPRLEAMLLGGREPSRYEGTVAGRPCSGRIYLASINGFLFRDGSLQLLTFMGEGAPVCAA